MSTCWQHNLKCVLVKRKYDKINFFLHSGVLGEVDHSKCHDLGNFFLVELESSSADGRKGN